VKEHSYSVHIDWTGNDGIGTAGYRRYRRDHEISAPGKQVIAASSDPAFLGDPTRYNPEELLVASVSQCHMLWYLHLCSAEGIVVTAYVDDASGVMREHPDGSGEFTSVLLRPAVTVSDPLTIPRAAALHHEIHRVCFIARSVNFPISYEPTVSAQAAHV
jgi:organic hydroperoxide reductase OsmC/OhrA